MAACDAEYLERVFFPSDQERAQMQAMKKIGRWCLFALISSVRAVRLLVDKQPVDDLKSFE